MHALILALAPVVVQATEQPAFAPPVDRPLAYTVSERREDATGVQHFLVERRVTFRRAADGYIADVKTIRVDGGTKGAGALLEAMTRTMVGRHVVLHLDSSGKVTGVDDADAVWAAQMEGMTAALRGRDPARAATIDALLAPLRALSAESRTQRIADMLAPLIVDRRYAASPTRSVTVPARAPDGIATLLAGTETVSAPRPGRMLVERHSDGKVGSATFAQHMTRAIDVVHGLVVDTTSVDTIDTSGGRLIVTRNTHIVTTVP